MPILHRAHSCSCRDGGKEVDNIGCGDVAPVGKADTGHEPKNVYEGQGAQGCSKQVGEKIKHSAHPSMASLSRYSVGSRRDARRIIGEVSFKFYRSSGPI